MGRSAIIRIFWLIGIWGLLAACSARENGAEVMIQAEDKAMTIEISSPAFENGSAIPSRFTCDGLDISPELEWQNLPEGTRSLALIVDDPDAPGGTWVHWVVFNMPAGLNGLPEDVGRAPGGGVDGNNSWKRVGYGGPCPPQGTHRYFFKLYALDTALELQPGVTKGQVVRAMEGHVLAEGQLMGTYNR